MSEYFESRAMAVRATEDNWEARRLCEQGCKRDMALGVLTGRFAFPPDLLQDVLSCWRQRAPEFSPEFTSHVEWQKQMCGLLQRLDEIFQARAARSHPYGADVFSPVAEIVTNFHARVEAQNGQ